MVGRRRTLIFKLLLCIPAVWICTLVLFPFNRRDTLMPVGTTRKLSKTVEQSERRVNEIQGFGPPIGSKHIPESAGGYPYEADQEQEKPNIPKPKKFVVNSNSPIYNQGDATQVGELGKAVIINKNLLTSDQRKIYDQGFRDNAFNQFVSDMISVHRSLPPTIDAECKVQRYLSQLPDTSVIVCFHNEAWSTLLRTVHSVLERTPAELLKEIILVDDFSDKEHTKQPLNNYMSQFPKVRILRMIKREGLIRARLRGGAVAKGTVITYLDSHCECMQGWIEPLLDRIARDPTTVVCPVIDVIDDDTFEYHYSKAQFTNVGGFDWSLQFNWHPIPVRDRKNRKRVVDPVPSPTMAGGLFSIDKAFFEKLGAYDPGFDIWGGENLELSFKIWMCGGRLEVIPCSHVGHIFRKRSPYKWRTGVNVLKRNSVRLAEVWMDDHKQYYYERINNQIGDFGDISERKALRKRLQCKSFKWYLDTIFPELFIPGDSIARGEVRNTVRIDNDGQQCLDSFVGDEYHNKPIVPYPCHLQGGNQVRNNGGGSKQCLDYNNVNKGVPKGSGALELYWCHNQGGNQYWLLSKDGEIRRDESCVDYAGQEVMVFACHGMKGNQEWTYDHVKLQLMHKVSGKCLEMGRDGAKLLIMHCNLSSEYQQWVFKHYDEQKARDAGMLRS